MGDRFTYHCTLCDAYGPTIKRSPGGVSNPPELAEFLIEHCYHGSLAQDEFVHLIHEDALPDWRERGRMLGTPVPNYGPFDKVPWWESIDTITKDDGRRWWEWFWPWRRR